MNTEKRTGYIQFALVIFFIIGSFTLSKVLKSSYERPGQNNADDRILTVETALVSPQEYRITFDTTGVVRARNQINIVPEVSGRVIEVHDDFFEGGSFNKGDILFKIEPRDFQLDVKRLEAEVARANTVLELANAESDAAIAEWRQINGDSDIPDLVAKKPQLAEASANLQAARAMLEDARLNLARTEFSLPFSGRVVSSNVAMGQYVMAGQTYGVVFDTSSLEVSASLVDRQLEWLMETDEPEINISLTFLGKRHVYPGQLKRTASTLDVGTRFATVYFSFNDEIKELLPGVFAEISITGTNMQDVMLLPSTALQSQGDVWRVTRNDTLELWRPEIIYMNDQEVVVKGIASEVRVVTSRISGATNGLKITTVSNSRNNEPE